MFSEVYRNKKVIVTGHTGFKGSWLVAWLKHLGAEVVGISLAPNTDPNHFEIIDLGISSHIVDIRDHEQLQKIVQQEKPDVVFHLAAQPLVRDSYAEPLNTFETNVMGTANVLDACRGVETVRAVVVITTDKCYENKEWVWGYRENDPMGGYDPYSASKGCAELVVSSYRRSFFNLDDYGKTHQTLIASARAGNVVGGGDWAKDRLIPDMIRAVVSNENVKIRNPDATRPWQHVLECLSGYLCLGEKLLAGEKQFAEAWNFAPTSEGTATVLSVVHLMQRHWSKIQYEIQQQTVQLHEAHLLKLDCSKANAILQWKNVWDLEQTIKATVQWYQAYYEENKILTLDHIAQYRQDAEKLHLNWTKGA